MFHTYPDNYIPIPVKEYRSVETNVPHHLRHTVGMRHTTLSSQSNTTLFECFAACETLVKINWFHPLLHFSPFSRKFAPVN